MVESVFINRSRENLLKGAIQMDPLSIESKKVKIGQTVYWYNPNGLALVGEVVKIQTPYAVIRISGGQRRQVRIDRLSFDKLKQKLKIN